MEVTVNADLCSACELCCDICPNVFEMNDDGVAVVLLNPVPDEFQDDVLDAVDQCAAGAIEVVE